MKENGFLAISLNKIVGQEVNRVLEQIRAEIEKMPTDYCGGYIGLDKKEVLQIIDKYKAESEDKK